MSVTRDDVLHIASLAKLHFDEDGLEAMRTQMNRMLDFVALLQEVDTEGVPPLSHPGEEGLPLRDDLPHTPLSRAEALRNAPAVTEDHFSVPKVIRS